MPNKPPCHPNQHPLGYWLSYARSNVGQCVLTTRPLNRGKITVDKKTFMDWIKNHLLPYLSKGVAVIMDNAPWHKGYDVRQMIESSGATLIRLPSYSPDLNPIEHAWANLKHLIKMAAHTFPIAIHNIKTQLQILNHSNLN